jgi:hypothetical protein
LNRTYVPKLGNMNGIVECSACEYRDQFVNLLAIEMRDADPVPEVFIVPHKELAPPRLDMSRLHDAKAYVAALARTFFRALGHAILPPAPAVPRRLERAHSFSR